MPKSIDIKGQVFGAWTVLEMSPSRPTKTQGTHWVCRCICGRSTEIVAGGRLRAGRFLRGCRICRGADHIKRGKCSPTYNTWRAMRERCLRPDSFSYDRYGGRGITICDRWMEFANFLADMGERPSKHTLDRIDNDGPYSPENCRWTTAAQQNRNSTHFKLTDDQVDAIRRLLVSGAKQIDVAQACGVTRGHIAAIAIGYSRTIKGDGTPFESTRSHEFPGSKTQEIGI